MTRFEDKVLRRQRAFPWRQSSLAREMSAFNVPLILLFSGHTKATFRQTATHPISIAEIVSPKIFCCTAPCVFRPYWRHTKDISFLIKKVSQLSTMSGSGMQSSRIKVRISDHCKQSVTEIERNIGQKLSVLQIEPTHLCRADETWGIFSLLKKVEWIVIMPEMIYRTPIHCCLNPHWKHLTLDLIKSCPTILTY